jgi:hypothetical protein
MSINIHTEINSTIHMNRIKGVLKENIISPTWHAQKRLMTFATTKDIQVWRSCSKLRIC